MGKAERHSQLCVDMRTLLGLAFLVAATMATAAVPYTGAMPGYILGFINAWRSKVALSRQQWYNSTVTTELYWPGSKKTYQLRWDAGLATNSSKRLNSLQNRVATYPLPAGTLEIHVGLFPNTVGTNLITNKEMFDYAWTNTWLAWISTSGVPSINYRPPANTGYTESYITQTYRLVHGNAQKIGCAFRNNTDQLAPAGAYGSYILWCQLSPMAFVSGTPVYPVANSPCEICSQCPATAPCNPKTGLCVFKATGK
ncbi:unnamed protein product, partial [Mesorhabditis belari]|uniref:Uncharacterized protein n=1 Tax=Mesorhabditis belari TaxID=2138241 RepID=A0AAF3J3I4_9BILA